MWCCKNNVSIICFYIFAGFASKLTVLKMPYNVSYGFRDKKKPKRKPVYRSVADAQLAANLYSSVYSNVVTHGKIQAYAEAGRVMLNHPIPSRFERVLRRSQGFVPLHLQVVPVRETAERVRELKAGLEASRRRKAAGMGIYIPIILLCLGKYLLKIDQIGGMSEVDRLDNALMLKLFFFFSKNLISLILKHWVLQVIETKLLRSISGGEKENSSSSLMNPSSSGQPDVPPSESIGSDVGPPLVDVAEWLATELKKAGFIFGSKAHSGEAAPSGVLDPAAAPSPSLGNGNIFTRPFLLNHFDNKDFCVFFCKFPQVCFFFCFVQYSFSVQFWAATSFLEFIFNSEAFFLLHWKSGVIFLCKVQFVTFNRVKSASVIIFRSYSDAGFPGFFCNILKYYKKFPKPGIWIRPLFNHTARFHLIKTTVLRMKKSYNWFWVQWKYMIQSLKRTKKNVTAQYRPKKHCKTKADKSWTYKIHKKSHTKPCCPNDVKIN